MAIKGDWVLEELVPHAHPMILIDTISELEPGALSSTVRISEDCPFYEAPLGVPSYVGIEYMHVPPLRSCRVILACLKSLPLVYLCATF